ncbi:MAG TPA: MBL fold metallo-hydrolase, partial [Candidatus Heimdallarchaeota archaeon]|nr:MBL fold metallo-hydrolase [Candidatus Heimdallarchaeota archaeon]
MKKRNLFFILFLCFILSSLHLGAQEEIPITIENVAGAVYCLYGSGGNIGIFVGEDSLLIVDAQYAKTADAVMAKIKELSPKKIEYLINTHYHGDHTSGNPIIGKDAQIISQQNCKKSLLAGLKPEDTPESIGAPNKTFDAEMTITLGDESVRLVHMGPGHTSGDTIVIFDKEKVIHAGDLFFYGMPPYIDVKDGSDTQNWVRTIQTLAEKHPDFQVIPGHGKVTTMKEYVKFADYLNVLIKEVSTAIKAGKTKEQAVESIDLSSITYIQDQ